MRARQESCCFTGHRPGKLPWKYNENDARAPDAKDADYRPGATVPHLTRLDLAVVKLYGIWKADDGSLASSYPVTLQNGGFEVPVNTSNYYQFHPETTKGLFWQTTASDNQIELGSVSTNLSPSECISSYHTAQARDGQQFAELNANQVGALYQDVATVPGVSDGYDGSGGGTVPDPEETWQITWRVDGGRGAGTAGHGAAAAEAGVSAAGA